MSRKTNQNLIPLQSIEVNAKLEGMLSEVSVTQTFANNSKNAIEAVYVFPLVEEATVLGVKMKIGKKKISAELKSKAEARHEYREARNQGHYAAMIEQERPNVFTMNVAGIEPGESIEVTTRYLAPVLWQTGGGRFRFPLVVAPRFIPGDPVVEGSGGPGWSPNTDEVPDASRITPKSVSEVGYTANIKVKLTPGFSALVACPSGQFSEAIALPRGETKEFEFKDVVPNRDFVLTYKVAAQSPTYLLSRNLFSGPEGKEEHLLLQLFAGKDQAPNRKTEVLFLLDVSGSMDGAKIEGLKKIVKKILSQCKLLEQEVTVCIVTFNFEPMVIVPMEKLADKHSARVSTLEAGGGTYLGNALTFAMKQFSAESEDEVERCIVVVADGQSEDKNWKLRKGVRVHTIGIDDAVNDDFLKSIANKTGGQFEFLLPGEDFDAAATMVSNVISGPVIRDLEILDVEGDIIGRKEIFASSPLTLAMNLKEVPLEFTLKGTGVDGRNYSWKIKLSEAVESPLPTIVYAKMKMRKTKDAEKQTALSLKYGFLGPTTSFVATYEKEIASGEKPERVDVPVLMPESWTFGKDAGGYRGSYSHSNLCGFGGGRMGSSNSQVRGGMVFGVASASSYNAKVARLSSFDPGDIQACGLMDSDMGSDDEVCEFNASSTDDYGDEEVGEINFEAEFDDLQSTAKSDPASDKVNKNGTTGALNLISELLDEMDKFLMQARFLKEMRDKLSPPDDATEPLTKKLNEAWADLEDKLKKLASLLPFLTELNRARFYCILTELTSLGFKTEIPNILKKEPTDVDARRLWVSANKFLNA